MKLVFRYYLNLNVLFCVLNRNQNSVRNILFRYLVKSSKTDTKIYVRKIVWTLIKIERIEKNTMK